MQGSTTKFVGAVFLLASLLLVASMLLLLPNATAIGSITYRTSPGEGDPTTMTPSGGGSESLKCSTQDRDGDGQTPCGGDCNDQDRNIFRGAIEYCGNSVDEDCDGVNPVCSNASVSVQTTQDEFFGAEPIEIN